MTYVNLQNCCTICVHWSCMRETLLLLISLYLTHWGQYWDNMAAILQTTTSNAFSWMKMYRFWVPKGSMNNIARLNQIMAWTRSLATSHYLNQWWSGLLTRISVIQPQWVKAFLLLVSLYLRHFVVNVCIVYTRHLSLFKILLLLYALCTPGICLYLRYCC